MTGFWLPFHVGTTANCKMIKFKLWTILFSSLCLFILFLSFCESNSVYLLLIDSEVLLYSFFRVRCGPRSVTGISFFFNSMWTWCQCSWPEIFLCGSGSFDPYSNFRILPVSQRLLARTPHYFWKVHLKAYKYYWWPERENIHTEYFVF
jgi:hypothetical protein